MSFTLVQMPSDPEEPLLDPVSTKETSLDSVAIKELLLDPVSTEERTTLVEDNGNIN